MVIINCHFQYLFFFSRHKIPVPAPSLCNILHYTLPLYFGFAVGYDIYDLIRDIIGEQPHHKTTTLIAAVTNLSHTPVVNSDSGVMLTSTAIYGNTTLTPVNITGSYHWQNFIMLSWLSRTYQDHLVCVSVLLSCSHTSWLSQFIIYYKQHMYHLISSWNAHFHW